MILDRFSTRIVILTTILLCVIGIGGFALTSSISWAYIFRFMSGIGSAFCFLSSVRLASRWFAPQKMAVVSGLIVTMAMIGGTFAQTPLTYLVDIFGWRHALLLDAALGLVITGVIFAVVRDFPDGIDSSQLTTSRHQLQGIGLIQSWSKAYLNPQNWYCGICTSLLNLPLALLGAIWGKLYLVQTQAFTNVQASYITMMLFIGAILGSPVAGWISDRVQRRVLPMQIAIVLSLALILMVMYIPALPLMAYLVIFFLLGFTTYFQVISYPLVMESNLKILTATSVSVVSFCAIGSYALFQPIFGWILDSGWKGQIVNNVHIYSSANYHQAILLIPAGFVLAFFVTLFMRESYCQNISEQK